MKPPTPSRPHPARKSARRAACAIGSAGAIVEPGQSGLPEPEDYPAPAAPEHPLVEFTLVAPDARFVAVAGTFNDWNPYSCPLDKGPNGTWSAELAVPRGHLEYRFIVDGRWCDDPAAVQTVPNPHGTLNAVLEV